ncbi:MAG: flippase-like domain-containing protein [Propionivibrio sp.]|nr:flippase-like domain-containing protein [Propionivibrio sp.]
MLYLIFRRIDLVGLQQLIANADILPILAGVVLNVLVVAIGAMRWHTLLRRYADASHHLVTSFCEYWKSLAVGVLVPGSLGSDAYRVMLVGRQKGYYLRSAFVIGIEKLAALFSCALLIASLYPLLAPNHLPGVVARIVDALYLIFLVGIVFSLFIVVVRGQSWVGRLAEAFNARLEALARRVASLASTPRAEEEQAPGAGLALVLTMFSPAVVLPVVALSLVTYLVSALQAQLYFQGMGYGIPFSVNLFVTPLLFLLFSLPISFGGIGIREGAFILLYGAFGVPAEIALVVSFCGLLGILLTYAVGASLFFLSKDRQQTADAS